jgi:hypothetical protein
MVVANIQTRIIESSPLVKHKMNPFARKDFYNIKNVCDVGNKEYELTVK